MAKRSVGMSAFRGKAVFIRTVTHYYTGHVEAVTNRSIVLSKAAWIGDTGRFYDALKTGNLSEIEPFPNGVTISREAIVDVSAWPHALPEVQK